MERLSPDCVGLDAACKVLVNSRRVQALIESAVGASKLEEALSLMSAGKLKGAIGADVHNVLIDAICNDAKNIWSGTIRRPHDDYPVVVHAYEGVYWVLAMDYDPVGYFLDQDSAILYARSRWDLSEACEQSTEDDGEVC